MVTSQPAFRHEAHPYAGRPALAPTCADLVRAGLDRDERPLMFAPAPCVEEVRDSLGPLARHVWFVPSEEHARNPGRVVTMLHSFAVAGDGRRALGVLEPDARGRRPAELSELLLTECVLNSPVLASLPMSAVCLVDDGLADVYAGMRRSHPSVQGAPANHDFDEALATELHASALPLPPADAELVEVRTPQLPDIRARVRSRATAFGVAPDRADDLVLAVNEIVTNSLRYGGGRAAVRLWTEDASVVCEVRDHGYLRDPMTGRLAPRPEATSGRGLWLVHHLCDLVQLRSSETSGTVVRLFVDR